jgi:hypothetical protein
MSNIQITKSAFCFEYLNFENLKKNAQQFIIMESSLRPHQIEAVQFIIERLEDNGSNGIGII